LLLLLLQLLLFGHHVPFCTDHGLLVFIEVVIVVVVVAVVVVIVVGSIGRSMPVTTDVVGLIGTTTAAAGAAVLQHGAVPVGLGADTLLEVRIEVRREFRRS
jgi:hypothetical protein